MKKLKEDAVAKFEVKDTYLSAETAESLKSSTRTVQFDIRKGVYRLKANVPWGLLSTCTAKSLSDY
jgi:hypothetical protein